ncbi:hypothetical protein LT697_00600 [Pseudomonas syringae pv. syringae]|uniref:hypothetical protein n=1 Tax=Pseudomonas syringae TaxID=317 RepID=UPI00200A92B8|nr:hypothetical protein [Pseudomonas syringae]MCK9740043.1 hypothetical protein [Pseudomonas syringae pv. syringae]
MSDEQMIKAMEHFYGIPSEMCNVFMKSAWNASWKASREELAIEAPEDFTAGGNPNARVLISHHREIVGRWVKSIEAAGVKVKS